MAKFKFRDLGTVNPKHSRPLIVPNAPVRGQRRTVYAIRGG
jgi:hypothetical protein